MARRERKKQQREKERKKKQIKEPEKENEETHRDLRRSSICGRLQSVDSWRSRVHQESNAHLRTYLHAPSYMRTLLIICL